MDTKIIKSRLPIVGAAIVLILGIIGFIRRPAASPDRFGKADGDTLTVGIEMSPLSYTLQNDTAEGFDYMVLRDIAREHKLNIALRPVADMSEAFRMLHDGKLDILIGSMARTTALQEHFLLTEPVYYDKQVLVQRADSVGGRGPILSQEQLRGDTVWVAAGSPNMTRLRNMMKELGDTIHVNSADGYSAEHLGILTALGEVKQAVINEAVARRLAERYPQLDIATPISFEQFQCWAVAPRDSVLCDSLDSWLTAFKETPRYRELIARYDLQQ